MNKKIWLFAALIACSTLSLRTAEAASDRWGPFGLFRGDPAVVVSGAVVGGGFLGAYYAIKPHHHHHVRAPVTGGKRWHTFSNTGALAITTAGCMAIAPMFAAAVVDITQHRELSSREALGLSADCVIPFLGSWYWNAYFDAHPNQDLPPRRRR